MYESSAARKFYPIEDYPSTPQRKSNEPPKIQRKLRVVARRKSSAKTLSFITFKSVVTFAIVILGICIMLYNQVQLNEVNGQVDKVNAEIVQLKSDHVLMKSSLESTLSYRNVEKIAEEDLGLQRIDPSQVEYLNIYGEDKMEVIQTAPPEGFSAQIEAFTARLITGLKDFFQAE